MKTKIVYVLVSDDADIFLEECYLSSYSARRHNPDAFIEVVMDRETSEGIRGKREMIREYVNKITVCDMPDDFSRKKWRSRYLKTNLRNLIQDDFLYIDTDTIICAPLDDVDTFMFDIAVAPEGWTGILSKNDTPLGNALDLVSTIGWIETLLNAPYFNSGVMYVKDTSVSHLLYATWYNYYRESLEKGVFQDQPSLCMANKKCGYPIFFLENEWHYKTNLISIQSITGAKILHYFNDGRNRLNFLLAKRSLYLSLKEYGGMSPFVKELVDDSPKMYLISENTFLRVEKSAIFFTLCDKNPFLFRVLRWIVRQINKIL